MGFKQGWIVLGLLVVFGLSEAQWPGQVQDPLKVQQDLQSRPVQTSSGSLFQDAVQNLLQDSSKGQAHQVVQGPVKPLNWRFPVMPQISTPAPVHFDRPIPAAVHAVAAQCSETAVHVEVKKDLFGTGEPIDVSVLTLGGCAAKGQDAAQQVLIYESELQGCNSNLMMTADELVYVFVLNYGASSPLAASPIVRNVAGQGATVVIECHYPRLHNVSSNALMPVWIPYASTHVAEELLVFSLRLMMADWVSESASNQYFLGELINIEASVLQFYHVPLRVYVDGCVATPVPDLNAVPRYSFIDNYGCFVDGKLTGSKSRFLPQTQGNKLDFQLEAFRFQQVTSNLIYIACSLGATAASFSPDPEHKACSFYSNSWVAAYGDSGVCGCCDGNCSSRSSSRKVRASEDLHLKGEVMLGPIMIKTV